MWACEQFNLNLYELQTFNLITDLEALKVIYSSSPVEDEELQAVRNCRSSGNLEKYPWSFVMVCNKLTFIGRVILRRTRIALRTDDVTKM